MLEEVFIVAKSKGANTIALEVLEKNKNSQRFYKKMGF